MHGNCAVVAVVGGGSAFGYTRRMAEADLRHRDRRGEWLPDPLPAPSALFSWPLRLWPAVRYLHHKYFDCNYGGEIIPLDKWFGSFFDGSSESEVEMRARRRRLKGMAT